MANLMATMTNLTVSVHGKKGAKHVTVKDYMPEYDEEKREEPKKQSVEDMKSILLGIANVQNAKVAQQKKGIVRKQSKTKGL